MTDRELECWLAEHVMGIRVCRDPNCGGCDAPAWVDRDGAVHFRGPWNPLTDANAALRLLDPSFRSDSR